MVTLVLIGINLAAFALELAQGSEVDSFVRRWGLVPTDVFGAALKAFNDDSGYYEIESREFEKVVERRVGPARFALLYVASAVAGSLAYLAAQPASQTPAVGASGAIAGVIAAHLVLLPGATLGTLAPVLFLSVVETAPTLLLLLLWLATQVFSSVASLTTSTGIAWWAHLGGFGTGLVLAPVLRRRRMAR